jgi:hypothetical protein
MNDFDAVEILAEFSKAIRHGLIALEGMNDMDGVDPAKVSDHRRLVRSSHRSRLCPSDSTSLTSRQLPLTHKW